MEDVKEKKILREQKHESRKIFYDSDQSEEVKKKKKWKTELELILSFSKNIKINH